MSEVFIVINLLTALANFVIGLVAVFKATSKKISGYFFGIILSGVIWSIFITLIEVADDLDEKVLFAKWSFIGPMLMPILLYNFIENFPHPSRIIKNKKINKVLKLIVGVLTVVFEISVLTTDAFISGATESNGTIKYEYGVLYVPFFLFFALIVGILLFSLYAKFKKSTGMDKLRLKYMFFGFTLSAIFATTTNLILPILGNDQPSRLGPASLIFLFGFTSYSIMQHRLFDIGTFVARIIQYFIVGTFLYSIVFTIRSLQIQVFDIDFYDPRTMTMDYIASIIVGIIISQFVLFVKKSVENIFTEGIQNYRQLLKIVDNRFESIIKLDDGINIILELDRDIIKEADIFFVRSNNGVFSFMGNNDYSDVFIDTVVLQSIASTTILQESEHLPKEVNILAKKLKAAIISKISKNTWIVFSHKYTKKPWV